MFIDIRDQLHNLEKVYMFSESNIEVLVKTVLYFLIASHAQSVVTLNLTLRPSSIKDTTKSIPMKEQHLTALGINRQE